MVGANLRGPGLEPRCFQSFSSEPALLSCSTIVHSEENLKSALHLIILTRLMKLGLKIKIWKLLALVLEILSFWTVED